MFFKIVTSVAQGTNFLVTVVQAYNNEPLVSASVIVGPLNGNIKTRPIMGLTDTSGRVQFQFNYPSIVQISYIGFNTITDTIYTGESKTYKINLESKNIQDVVVTGQYADNQVKKSVYDVKVITPEMLRAKGANNLREALAQELSIDIGQDQVFGSYLGINGISGEGVKIMVDGVPLVGRLDGKLDLSEININNIERVEIVEGPLSVLYGTDAMGGVINIITKKTQQEKVTVNLKGYYESVGQYNVELNAGFAFKKSRLFVTGGRNFFGGYTTLDSVQRFKEWKPKEQYFADAKYIYTGNRFRVILAGAFFRELMLDRSAPVQTLSYDNNDTAWTYLGYDLHYLTYRARGSASFMYRFKEDQQLDVLVAYSGFIRHINEYVKNLVTLNEKIVNDPSEQDTTKFHQLTVRATYTMPAWKKRLNFQFGIDVNQQYAIQSNILDGKQQSGDYAAFGSARISIVPGLDIQPAIRFSYNTRFNVPLIPSLNVRYTYRDRLVVRASYGRGYRAPSLEELFLNFFDSNHALKGNSQLKPEDGHSVNASINYTQPIKKHTINLSVAGFYNNIQNKIDWAIFAAPFPPDTYEYFNLKHYVTYGANATLGYRWSDFHISASTQLTGYDLSTGNSGAVPVKTWSPDFTISTGYLIPKALLGINITYKYNGIKPLFSVNSSIQSGTRDAYNMLNASLTRNFWKDRIQLTVGAKNLLGVKNVTASNVSGVGHNIGGNDVNIAWGRTAFVMLVLHYGK